MNNTAVAIVCHDDHYLLDACIRSYAPLPVTVFVSSTAWDGSVGKPERCADTARNAGAEVIICDCPGESEHRRYALSVMKERGVRWLLVPDSDEVIEKKLLDSVLAAASSGIFDQIRVRMHTFWKSPSYRIHPPEELAPILLIDAQKCEHIRIREYTGSKPITLGFEHGALLHGSYVGPDERILRKISTWGHRTEVVQDWYQKVWLGWDADRTMRNLHPTHPHCYGFAEHIPVPRELATVPMYRRELSEPPMPPRWLKISVVIPLYGGPVDLSACLESVERCGVRNVPNKSRMHPPKDKGSGRKEEGEPLFHEVIIVDDCSPDNAAEVARACWFARFIQNEKNLGFGGTCNVGYEASSGELILFLNSDTRVTRAAIIRLVESIIASGTIAAVGPMSNNAGYHQLFQPTCTDIKNLDAFATDFAFRELEDLDVSMVVGFCLLVRRSVLEELGAFDTKFGRGLFEDTDLVHRMIRAQYRVCISSRSFVHHEGSKSLARVGLHPSLQLAAQKKIYDEKWRLDKETGFAPALAGEHNGPISFNFDRQPEVLIPKLRKLAKEVGISLCMIVKNEERVLGDCLKSLHDVFPEVIIADTGSTDRTIEIAKSFNTTVIEIPWEDSFSAARNRSIEAATGKWILWVDADDTIPFVTLETLVHAAAHAQAHINGFIIPIQFVEDGPGGTRVDHVKLFRNDPRHRFEGRIHEQILSALRETGGDVERILSPILHSGYDTSPEGQRRKRIRDRKLLALDLRDRPTHPFVLFNLGMTAYYTGRFRVAIGWLRRSILASQLSESHLRKAFSLYGLALRGLGRPEDAAAMFERGLAAVGEDPELRFNLAMVFTDLGQFEAAKAQYIGMDTDTTKFFSSVDTGILGHKRLNNLASVCFALGHEREAKNYLREAIAEAPHFMPSVLALFEAGVRSGDLTAMREASDAVARVLGPCEDWAQMRVAISEFIGIDPEPELARMTNEMPQAQGPGIVLARRLLARGIVDTHLLTHLEYLGNAEAARHLSSVDLSRGELALARRHAEVALQLGPGNPDVQRQMEAVELALDDADAPELEPLTREQAMTGPHVGQLGEATLERSVVVVTFNSTRTICECLERVLSTLGPEDELIVVDSHSTDDTVEMVHSLISTDPRTTLIALDENVGYSKACNEGVVRSKGKYIVALNPDAFVNPGWLDSLCSQLVGNLAAAGPVSDYVAGDQFVGHYVGDRHVNSFDMAETLAAEQAGKTRETKLLMGVCLAMRRDLLNRHGLLCEETFLGADDLEFSWRYRQLGYRLSVAQSVFVRHVGGASFSTVPRIETRKKVRRSDRALIRRLEAFYGKGKIPSSMELFGCGIFDEALALVR